MQCRNLSARRVWVVGVLAFTICFPFSQARGEDLVPSNWAENMNAVASNTTAYANVIRAYAELVRMLAEARLASAKADLVEAQAAHEWEEVRRLHLLVNRLQLELRNLAKAEYAARSEAKKIDEHAKRMRLLVNGVTSSSIFQSLRWVFSKAVEPSILSDAMRLEVPSLRNDVFIPNRKNVKDIAEFSGGNVGQLLRFLEKNDYSLEPWTEGHFAIVASLQKLLDSTRKTLSDIQTTMKELRDGTLDIWKDWGNKPKPPAGASTTASTPSGPAPSPITPNRLPRSHSYCLSSKAGFPACVDAGFDPDRCLVADKGFVDCLAAGGASDTCIPAKSQFKPCLEEGGFINECVAADSGYKDCREDGHAPRDCFNAKSGYRACRDLGYPYSECLLADKGFADCWADSGNKAFCLAARGTYKYCREAGFPPSTCVAVGKGFQMCRENGYPPSACATADEGYKDCVTGST